MPFPRQRHDGTHEYAFQFDSSSSCGTSDALQDISPVTFSFRTRNSGSRSLLLWVSLSAASLPALAQVAQARTLRPTNEPKRGAWGWTQGEQTYLRVRPSKNDPIVAKVPHATRVFVWGKFNGWYRVETTDHKFGWVFHDFLKCPKTNKVAPLTHAKATSASNRASAQTLYGTTAVLKTYYVRHGSSGAARGLAQHGVRLASAPSHAARVAAAKAAVARAAAARRIQLASARARAGGKPAVVLASKPWASKPSMIRGAGRGGAGRLAQRNRVHSPLQLASAVAPVREPFGVRSEQVGPDGQAPRLVSGAHFEVRQSTRDYSVPVYTPHGDGGSVQFNPRPSTSPSTSPSVVPAPTAAARPQTSRTPLRSVPFAPSRPPSSVGRRVGVHPVAPHLASRPAAAFKASTRVVIAPHIAQAPVAPQPKRLSRALPPVMRPVVPISSTPAPALSTGEATVRASTPVASVPVAVAPVQSAGKPSPVQPGPAVVRAAPRSTAPQLTAAQVHARARLQRRIWFWKQQQARRNRRLAWRGSSRNRLRSRMGAVPNQSLPPLPVGKMRPISPEELMRARQSHMANGGQSTPNSLADGPSTGGPAPSTAGSSTGGFSQNTSPDGSYSAPPNRDLSPRSDASAEEPSAYFSFASYTPGSMSVAVLRTDESRATRWAAPQDGPDADEARNKPRSLPLSTPAPAAKVGKGVRAGSPRDLLWAARLGSGAHAPAAARKANVVASRGRGASTRGGSPRDAYAAQMRASGMVFGRGMADSALSYRGTPYRSGGTSPNGFDCSGLVYFLLRQRGFNPPRTAAGLASFGRPVGRNELQAGDIVLFANTYKRGVSHVGIYLGNNQFVHAPHTGSRVRTDILFAGYYAAKYYGARRPR